jgi:hypothetical protein
MPQNAKPHRTRYDVTDPKSGRSLPFTNSRGVSASVYLRLFDGARPHQPKGAGQRQYQRCQTHQRESAGPGRIEHNDLLGHCDQCDLEHHRHVNCAFAKIDI